MIRHVVGLFLFVCTMAPVVSSAATLYMSPQSISLNRGDSATVSIRLDVDEEECINVIDATITFPETIVPVDISRGTSILGLWVEDPVIDRNTNTITFAGGIPNGYCGRIVGDPRLTNNIIDIIVQSPSFVVGQSSDATTTEARLDFGPETRLLLNNNTGSEAEATLLGTTITLSKQAGQGENDWLDEVAADDTPPNDFAITLERTPNAFSNQYFITFNTSDKQSGIDHYEVIEEPIDDMPFFRWGREDAPWVRARSPYVLNDQSLNSVVRVRAIDKAGNEFVATLVPEEEARTMSESTKLFIVVVAAAVLTLLLVMVLIVWLMLRRGRKRNAAVNDADDSDDSGYDDDEEFEAEDEVLAVDDEEETEADEASDEEEWGDEEEDAEDASVAEEQASNEEDDEVKPAPKKRAHKRTARIKKKS